MHGGQRLHLCGKTMPEHDGARLTHKLQTLCYTLLRIFVQGPTIDGVIARAMLSHQHPAAVDMVRVVTELVVSQK